MEKELYNLTNPQKSILLTEEFYKGSNVNNICGTAIIDNKLDFNILKKAMNIFVKNHDSFNMKLVLDNNEVKQYLDNTCDIDIEIVDVNSKDDISKVEDEMLKHVFNIYNGDLFCMKIFRLPDNTGGFIVNVHHLYGDSWSLGIVANDIVRIYSCLLHNEDISTDDKFSYIDYIYSEKEYLGSDKFKKDKEYWNNIFSTIPEQATIPSSISNVDDAFTCKAKRIIYNIDNNLMNRIQDYCRINRVSVFNFFMAVYSIYLGRVSGLDDFVIGTPILNRTNFNEKNTTGMFINTAPLRIYMDNNMDFKSFVSNIAKDSFGMLRHQKYYYQTILEDLRKTNPNLPNLYNILISYQVTRTNIEKGLNYSTRWNFNGTTADDIDIHLFDLNDTGSINVAYDYKLSKYTEDDICAVHNRILHIISQIINHENICLCDVDIVTEDEKHKILYDFNNTDFDYDENIPFIYYFEKQAKLSPNNIALTFHGQNMDYKTLNRKANSLANLLRDNDIKNNSIVGIMVNRSFEMIISILAVLKAGGGYIPIDPDFPDERINYMVKDSNMQLLLTQKNINKSVYCSNTLLVDLEQDFYAKSYDDLTSILKPEDLSYLIYTSGSTGVPKGVMLTQKSLVNFYHAIKQKISYLKDEKLYKILSITTVSFDIFAFETLISLVNGLHVFITDIYEQKSTVKLENIVNNYNIDIIQTTPSVMSFHLDNLTNTDNFSKLKYVILAGEQLPLDLVNRIKRISPKCIVYNGYGPSETTIFSSVQDVTSLNEINIGKPIANTKFYILDTHQRLLPKHHIGEIYIAGDGLGLGYLGKSELTNKNFLPNPFIPGTLYYKTGDLGCWLNDGCISCKGRLDHQVKLRGLRIELGEIEEKINMYHVDIQSAVVVKNINNTDFLYAFLSTKNKVNISSLKAYLISCLPNYMIPSNFIILDSLPKTPNGKIDRKALKTYPVSENNIDKDIVLPQNEVEQFIYHTISDIMHKSNFSMLDDLYSIGMDSLSIIVLSNRIEAKYHIVLSMKELYLASSLIELAKLIVSSSIDTTHFTMSVAPDNDSYDLSEEQLSIFYATKMSPPDSLSYNVSGGIVIDGFLPKEKVEFCFKKLIERHSSFRTIFKFMDQEPRQIILDSVPFSVESFSGDSSKIDEIISAFPNPFSLENAPLLRIAICYLENNKTLLLLDSHHIIMDGISLQILVKEFCSLYDGESLSLKSWRYIDFSFSEKNYINSNDILLNKDYWIESFKNKDIPIISLPYDYSPSSVSDAGDTLYSSISEKAFSMLEIIAKQEGVSTYIVFLTIFYLLLYNYTSQNNILIGVPVANRSVASLKNIIGMFVNNAVLDVTIDSNKTVSQLLQDIKLVFLDAMEHQPYPYHDLIKNLNLNGKNLFDVMFVYQNEYNDNFLLNNSNIDFCYANTNTSKFNLSCEILPFSRKIKLEYRTDLFKTETIQRLLDNYIYILENVSDFLFSSIHDCDILLPNDKNKLLYEFNNTSLCFNKQNDLLKLFEERAITSPEKIAIIFEGNFLTYKELNERANAFAHHLYANSVVVGDTISILLNRSFDLIIAIYAVLKCGASYVLIDPSFPEERINYIIKDSHSKYCVTSSTLANHSSISGMLIDLFDFNTGDVTNISNVKYEDNLCMIYTSGSTGKPKGVILHKHGFTNLLYCFDHEMNISSYSRILGIATVSFDMFMVELFSSLSFGNTLVLANEEEQKNIIAMSRLMKQYKIEFFVTTPSRVELLLLDECENPLKNVKAFQLGGEKFTPTLYERLRLSTNANIYNGYGPTEITACCSNKLITSSDITIGRPIGNVQIYICNSDMNICPIGVIGEICIAGDGVSNGYLNRPDITAKNFIKNPFGNGILYKSGDLAKYRNDGEIEYIGRSDFQVKIRGLRIELSEIEAKLNALNSVEQSTILYKSNCKFPYLIAFVVSKTDINVHDIKTKLKNSLPTYMIPRYIIRLDALPITSNGKIDRKALENYELPTSSSDIRNDYTPPKTDRQKLFCSIWSSLLNLEVGIDDDLFDIGADSLLAIKFKTQLLSHHIDLPYADIFKYRTIRKLCKTHNSEYNKNSSLNTYNYGPIQELLNNQSDEPMNFTSNDNVLLLGSTGFIGMHIINSFIKNTTGKIYCMVREKNKISANTRFMDLLHFYFGTTLDSFIDSRIFIVKGNILKDKFGLSNQVYQDIVNNTTVVINAAANVKHYGSADKFKSVNINALQNAIIFCLEEKKRLIHLSSLSISGNMVLDNYLSYTDNFTKKSFTETDLYIGQTLDNVYSRSKFEAERIILDAIVNKHLNAQILRLGNITSRYLDGVFQVNPEDNAFANRLKTFLKLDVFPDYLLNNYMEFTPVDLCADAIICVLNNYCFNTIVYHIYNNHHVYFSEFLKYLKLLNFEISICSEDDFREKINSIISQNDISGSLSGIINDFDTDQKLDYSSHIQITNIKTNKFLSQCNFNWPDINFDYIEKYISYLKKNKFIN